MYTPIRIIIADDHEIFRNGFKLLFKKQDQLELVGEAENGEELLEIVAKQKPDMVITDIKMPLMDGIEACRTIRTNYPAIKVIALSMFDDDSLIMDMLAAGARGYLLKNTNKAELLMATKVVKEGHTYYCNAIATRLAMMIAECKFTPSRNQPVQKFRKRENEIIKLICEQYSNKEIATLLGLSIRTVESHRENIQEKTGARNTAGVVVYAIKHQIFQV